MRDIIKFVTYSQPVDTRAKVFSQIRGLNVLESLRIGIHDDTQI